MIVVAACRELDDFFAFALQFVLSLFIGISIETIGIGHIEIIIQDQHPEILVEAFAKNMSLIYFPVFIGIPKQGNPICTLFGVRLRDKDIVVGSNVCPP